MNDFLEKNKKTIKTVLSVTFVAWLSNYLYDALLIPNFFDKLLKFLSIFFSNFVDLAVGKAVHSSNFPYLTTLWIIVVPISAAKLVYSFIKKKEKKTFLSWIILIAYSSLILVSTLSFSLNVLTYNLIVPSVKNHIEILEPYIPEEKYKLMKSDYYRLNTYKDYQQLKKEIEEIMHEKKLDSSQVSYNPDQ